MGTAKDAVAWVNETINLVERAIEEGDSEAISVPVKEGGERVNSDQAEA